MVIAKGKKDSKSKIGLDNSKRYHGLTYMVEEGKKSETVCGEYAEFGGRKSGGCSIGNWWSADIYMFSCERDYFNFVGLGLVSHLFN